MTAFQKTAVGIALVLIAGTAVYESIESAAAQAEIQNLRQQAGRLEQVQAELDRTRKELAASRVRTKPDTQDNSELLKLRGQVTVLQNQLVAAMAQANLQSATNRSGIFARGMATLFSKGDLKYAGFQTPENAFQSFLSAMIGGQFDQVMAALPPDVQEKEGTPAARQAFEQGDLKAKTEKFQGFQILAKKVIGDDKVDLQVAVFQDGSGPELNVAHFVKIGDEWKFSDKGGSDGRA